jgi:glycosyltransferase involved in cell wall biosynthesis
LGDDTRAFREIKKIIEEYRPHIVHTHAAKPGAIGRLAASVCKVPVIVHTYHGHVFHSYFGKAKTQFFIQAERYLASKTDRIIAISDQQKTELVDTFRICKPEKMTVIPLGLDLRKFYEDQEQKRIRFRKKLGISDDELAIGIVGRVVPIKNHKLFIDAIQEVLSKTSRKLRFVVVGDGDMRESLFSLLDQYLITYNYLPEQTQPAQVTFTSWLTEMDEVYAGLEIVALTSLNEGTPVSLIEAQAANKPIVSTRVGGVEDVVIENKTALLCPSEQVSPFSDALLRLTENDHLRHQMGQFGNQHVKDRFDKDRLVSDVRSLYHQLLAEKNVPH